MSILDYFPDKYPPREVQTFMLSELEKFWDDADIFVIRAAVAAGKSPVAKTTADWLTAKGHQTAVVTNQVVLQDQYEAEFPDLPIIKGSSRYECRRPHMETCEQAKELLGAYCGGCPCVVAKRRAMDDSVGVFNFYTYLLVEHKKDVVIFDEAHNLTNNLEEFYTLKLWHHLNPAAAEINTTADLVEYLELQIDDLKRVVRDCEGNRDSFLAERNMGRKVDERAFQTNNKNIAMNSKRVMKYENMISGLRKSDQNFFLEHVMGYYKGVEHRMFQVRPINLRYVPHNLWPERKVRKVILMSATISEKDLETLGLQSKRIKWIYADSPIPAENRPVIMKPVGSMSYKYQERSLPKVAAAIVELAKKHETEKGIIHCTYSIAQFLRRHLTGDRYLWHNREDKIEIYQEFRNSTEPKILIASGMSEGIDLVEDAGRWQVITKVMYPSLADGLIKKRMQLDQDWYDWITARTIMQQLGRICRTPTDYGITYILDAAFVGFYEKTKYKLWPKYIVDSIRRES